MIKRKKTMVNPAETLNADDLLLIYYYEEIIDEELDECFDIADYLKNIDRVFKKFE